MTKQFKKFTACKLEFGELTDLIFNELLIKNANVKYIQILNL